MAFDGFSASGKSFAAKMIARKYKLKLLNSGLLYRYAAYIILKEIGGWGWHYGDIIGLFLLAFLPGALFIGGMLEDW